MNEIESIDLDLLSSRLHELEWKLSKLGSSWNARSLPYGLFNNTITCTPEDCIYEIKSNILKLRSQQSPRVIRLLAELVQQQIHVLVRICLLQSKKKEQKSNTFTVKTLSTRQQWLEQLNLDIQTLSMQQQALLTTLNSRGKNYQSVEHINLLQELGEIERQLTVSKEKLARAIS